MTDNEFIAKWRAELVAATLLCDEMIKMPHEDRGRLYKILGMDNFASPSVDWVPTDVLQNRIAAYDRR